MYKQSRKNKRDNVGQTSLTDAEYGLSGSLKQNIMLFHELFKNDDTVIYRYFVNQTDPQLKYCAIFVDGMVDKEIVSENIIWPIINYVRPKKGKLSMEELQDQVILVHDIKKTADLKKITEALNYGDTVLLADGVGEVLIISSQGWPSRAITEPENEKTLRGPKEGFTESLMTNLSLIRRKLNTHHQLKFKFKVLGLRADTKACICYIEGLASPAILSELEKRLDQIDIDCILGSGYIVELIKDAPLSPFKTIGNTERPDVVAAKLLEGRLALLSDGSPIAITLPYIFMEYFQSDDDYYINFYFSSISRILRIIAFFFTISIPAIYLALSTFHQEILPTPLLLSISAARQGVAFPTIIELIILGLAFEILREAGIRMPAAIGQALSIVGALILGQAAVEARIVSAPMIIVTGLTAVTGLMIPGLSGAVIILRFTFVVLSTLIGLYGYIFGMFGLCIHLFEIRSFGVPYMSPLDLLNFQNLKDTVFRAPWWYMRLRPKWIGAMNRVRQSARGSKP